MNPLFSRRARCALCKAPASQFHSVLSLAPTPPANEFLREADLALPQESIPLTLVLCSSCGHVQLAEIVDPERLFRHYVYVSGTSSVFVAHFSRYAASAISRFGLGTNSFVVEVGSNDGTLLKQFKHGGVRNILGVDPASDIAEDARGAGVPTLDSFFSPDLAAEIRRDHGPADLVCANNVFAHSDDLTRFADAVSILLDAQGVFIFEVSYLVDVIQKLLFDTIYHEHVSYHALTPLIRFFASIGLRLFDAERIDTHGGSIRGYVCHREASHPTTDRLSDLVALEREMGVTQPEVYSRFKSRIQERGAQLRSRLAELRKDGKSIAGFGAPAKLTTLMHEFGLDRQIIAFVVDDSVWKQGRFTPGTHIPVVPADQLYERRPDFCVVFAWNFADSIVAKHSTYTKNGGHFIVPLPEIREL